MLLIENKIKFQKTLLLHKMILLRLNFLSSKLKIKKKLLLQHQLLKLQLQQHKSPEQKMILERLKKQRIKLMQKQELSKLRIRKMLKIKLLLLESKQRKTKEKNLLKPLQKLLKQKD